MESQIPLAVPQFPSWHAEDAPAPPQLCLLALSSAPIVPGSSDRATGTAPAGQAGALGGPEELLGC